MTPRSDIKLAFILAAGLGALLFAQPTHAFLRRVVLQPVPEPPSPSELVLVNSEIAISSDGIRELLKQRALAAEDEKDVPGLIRSLGAETFREREDATRRLLAMKSIPIDALMGSMKMDDPEIRARAARILREAQMRLRRTPIAMFAALRVVERKKLPGLIREILTAMPSLAGEATKAAARAALLATVGEGDRQFILRQKNSESKEVREAAIACLRVIDGEPPVDTPEGNPSWQSFLNEHLIRGDREFGVTEFTQIDREILGKAFKIETRTADTSQSVDSRYNTSRWLYPVRGQNECPLVITDSDRRLKFFPIWGSWRQNWNGKWMPLDEKGGKINAADSPTGVGHLETKVDYLVVPAG